MRKYLVSIFKMTFAKQQGSKFEFPLMDHRLYAEFEFSLFVIP